MTNYEIITIVLEVVEIVLAFGSFVIALLTFFRKKNGKQK